MATCPTLEACARCCLGRCLQVPIDPISMVPGLLEALNLMDAAVQQNIYREKLLMYRNVRMPDHDKVHGLRSSNVMVSNCHT